MSDIVSVTENAAKDAGALVAALYRGDEQSAGLLASFYEGNTEAQSLLCGSLAALAAGILKMTDNVRDRIYETEGLQLPSGRQLLDSLLIQLASVDGV